jgi:hypothetical protein
MDLLPLELENTILSYKYDLEHYEKFKYCLEKIKLIKCEYFTRKENNDIWYETKMIKNNMETWYYITCDYDQIEMSFVQTDRCFKYWLYTNNKLETYYKIKNET